MIKSLGQIMLYVKDLDANARFWKEQAGFEKVEKISAPDGGYIYLVSPLQDSEVELVLQDKIKVEQQNDGIYLGTPSILMRTDDLEQTYQYFVDHGVKVNPIMELPGLRFFNFADNEDNYFAIQEVKK